MSDEKSDKAEDADAKRETKADDKKAEGKDEKEEAADEADEADDADDKPASRDDKPAKKPQLLDPTEKAEQKAARNRAKWKLFWIVSVLSLAADQLTKVWARASLDTVGPQGHECVIPDDIKNQVCSGVAHEVIGSFWHWRLSMNPGSAFGLFSSQGQAGRILLSLVGIGAVAGMLWMLKKARGDQKVLHWALALVAGGAVGNLIDRIYYGVVTDFILWHWGSGQPKGQPNRFTTEWPVFNVADIVLVVGVGLMFIDIQKEGKREKAKKKRRQEKARAAGLVKDL